MKKNNDLCNNLYKSFNSFKNEFLTLPNIATDAIVYKKISNDEELKHDVSNYNILLIKRKYDPHKNKYAFPGGFVDYNEDPNEGCLRELLEEASITGFNSKIFTVKSDPKRDPRKHIVSFIYSVEVSEDAVPQANDDALTAKYYNLKDIINQKDNFAFDHYEILLEYITKEMKIKL